MPEADSWDKETAKIPSLIPLKQEENAISKKQHSENIKKFGKFKYMVVKLKNQEEGWKLRKQISSGDLALN